MVLVALVVGWIIFALSRPLPLLTPRAYSLKAPSASTVSLSQLTNASESAIGAVGYGILATNGGQTGLPTASTAKLITALTVLKRYPLATGNSGPYITISATDVSLYNKYLAEDGSVLQVTVGEQLSEYQMLVAMMLPSANNIADSLATWAFGSLSAYSTAANQFVKSMGLTNTVVGSDASGFLPGTTSSAHDLVLLGEAVMANPVLAAIVSEPQADLPVAGTVYNYNPLLGHDGIIGIKTGNTNQAGGVYVFAAEDQLDASHKVAIVGAVVGAPSLQAALNDGSLLLDSARQGFAVSQMVNAGQAVGVYQLPWGGSVLAVATAPLVSAIWRDAPSTPQVSLQPKRPTLKAGAKVGTVYARPDSSVKVVLKQNINGPPWWWRLIHF